MDQSERFENSMVFMGGYHVFGGMNAGLFELDGLG